MTKATLSNHKIIVECKITCPEHGVHDVTGEIEADTRCDQYSDYERPYIELSAKCPIEGCRQTATTGLDRWGD